tara:strand:+ start:381 stop:779 length:399 start_codon:yes stop_codon:yes gene_type:complete
MKIKTKTKPYYESRLYIGSIIPSTANYSWAGNVALADKEFSQPELEKCVGLFQDDREQVIPVRITPTSFISGSTYRENGWEICAINYPKIDTDPNSIDDFMRELAIHLLENFRQHSISVVNSDQIFMYQSYK